VIERIAYNATALQEFSDITYLVHTDNPSVSDK